MTALIPILANYGAPYAIKGIALLAAYIGGRIHQHKIESPPAAPPAKPSTAFAPAPTTAEPPSGQS